jgi:hypothetical protein
VKDGFEGNGEIMKELGVRWKKLDKKQEKWNMAAKLENEKNGFSSGGSTSGSEKGKKQVEEDEVEEEEEIEEEDENPLKKGKATRSRK